LSFGQTRLARPEVVEDAHMNDGEWRESKWIGKAMFAGGIAGFVLGCIGYLATRQRYAAMGDSEGLIADAVGTAILGSIVGMIGAAARTPNRASLVGACLFGFPIFVCSYQSPTVDRLWQLAGLASLGSVLCQVGAVAGGTAASGEKQPYKIQFTIMQSLMFFIPFAVYFGYLRTLMQK
jgi:hypothetical protein